MCGIIGIVGKTPAAPRLIESLKRLEYRGYDSAGVATIDPGKLDRRRATGKINEVEAVLAAATGSSGARFSWMVRRARSMVSARRPRSTGLSR